MKLCGFEAGLDRPLFLIAGPCAIESRQLAIDTAGELKAITTALGMPFIYKSSFDKANRTSAEMMQTELLPALLKAAEAISRTLGTRR